jgi:hypothetical protein
MILLDQVVHILRRSQSRLLRQRLVSLHYAYYAVRRRVTLQCDGFRSEPLTRDRLREEGLRRGNIAPGAEPEVDRLSRSINGTPTSRVGAEPVPSVRRPRRRRQPVVTCMKMS